MRALSTADSLMDEAAAAALGLHVTDLHAGEALDREGPMTVGELANSVGITLGAATALVDRLELAGLASRRPDPTSRRRVLVQPTKEAGARAYAVFGPLVQRSSPILSSYSEAELLRIRDFLRDARELLQEHGQALRAGGVIKGQVAGSDTRRLQRMRPSRGRRDRAHSRPIRATKTR